MSSPGSIIPSLTIQGNRCLLKIRTFLRPVDDIVHLYHPDSQGMWIAFAPSAQNPGVIWVTSLYRASFPVHSSQLAVKLGTLARTRVWIHR